MYRNTDTGPWLIGGIVVTLGGLFLIAGPKGLSTGLSAWKASSYGSDWQIVQYAQSGCVIATWSLNNEAVHNETNSDGIYFRHGNQVVHLSGHYLYVQDPGPSLIAELGQAGFCKEGPNAP